MADTFPTLPETSVEPIEASELKQELFDRLCSGWSPARAANWLREQGVAVHPYQVRRFFEEIPDIYILPPTLVKTRLKMLDIKVDSLVDLGRAIRLQEERVEAHLLLQSVTSAEEGLSLQRIDKAFRKDLEAWFSMLVQYTKVLQSLGIMEQQPVKFDMTSEGEKLPTLRDLVEIRSAAQRAGPDAHSSDASS